MIAAVEGILTDEVVYQAARGQVAFTELDPIQVKGRDEPLPVFRPTAVKAGTVHHSMLDKLPPAQQMLLKIASVIGVTFSREPLLAIYPQQSSDEDLDFCLGELLQTGLIQEREGDFVLLAVFSFERP